MSKTIYDSTCPKCGSNNWYSYNTDEIEFSFDGTGHYYIDCECKDCYNDWRQYYKFKYVITKEWGGQ